MVRVSAETRKGVGDSLAGARDCSRRHDAEGRCDTRRSARSRGEKRRDPGAEASPRPAHSKAPTRSRVTFRHAGEQNGRLTVLPMYKHSTQKNHRHIVEKHLLPQFGDKAICDVTRQEVQTYVAHLDAGRLCTEDHRPHSRRVECRAPHGGEVGPPPGQSCARGRPASAENRSTEMGADDTQAAQLLEALPPLARTMVGLALLSGLRRGELFALRWRDLEERRRMPDRPRGGLRGAFDTPKTEAGVRQIPLSDAALRVGGGLESPREAAPSRTRWSSRRGRASRSRRTTCCGGRSSRRATALGLPTGDLADVPTHLLLVGARERRAGQGRRAADGTRQSGHDAERVHAGDRRLAADGRRQGRHPNCSQLFTIAEGGARTANSLKRLAPQPGLEPGTLRLTAGCSTIELLRNRQREPLVEEPSV